MVKNTRLKNKKLKNKLLFVTLPITIASLLVISAVFYFFTKNEITNSTEKLLTLTNENISSKLGEHMRTILSNLNVIGDNIEKKGISKEDVESLLGKYNLDCGIYVYYPDGQCRQLSRLSYAKIN
ncbi:hypothetical protein [Clostridium sp. BJN0001]|uniref:hypothetical protein n=1 Tax=Clostridium sp. BJN0001 TaxID=2930219 RepID=UPI001FD37C48|nr:hypothetical protein [Clostridium sp. BJN0001]